MSDNLAPMPRKKKEETDPLRVPKSLVKKIRIVCAHSEESPQDWLERVLTPILDVELLRRAEEELQKHKTDKKK